MDINLITGSTSLLHKSANSKSSPATSIASVMQYQRDWAAQSLESVLSGVLLFVGVELLFAG